MQQINLSDMKNEDGTSMADFPKNPLLEKWVDKYAKRGERHCERNGVCSDYICELCSENCPYSENWVVPEEDAKEYREYMKAVKEYNKVHNPKLYKWFMEVRDE